MPHQHCTLRLFDSCTNSHACGAWWISGHLYLFKLSFETHTESSGQIQDFSAGFQFCVYCKHESGNVRNMISWLLLMNIICKLINIKMNAKVEQWLSVYISCIWKLVLEVSHSFSLLVLNQKKEGLTKPPKHPSWICHSSCTVVLMQMVWQITTRYKYTYTIHTQGSKWQSIQSPMQPKWFDWRPEDFQQSPNWQLVQN